MQFDSTGRKTALRFALIVTFAMVPALAYAHGRDDHGKPEATMHEARAKTEAAGPRAKAALTRAEALAREAEMKAAEKARAAAVKARQTVEGAAEDLEHVGENIKESKETLEKTYRADRARGEGVVEASGDAYEAVLKEGNERAAEKKKRMKTK